MPTFEPFDSFQPRQLCTKVTDLVLCGIPSFDFVMMTPCRPKYVGILNVILKYKKNIYLRNNFVYFVGLVQ